MAETRGQARPKRQLQQLVRYDPGKQSRQKGFGTGGSPQDHAARDAATLLKATSKQASKAKAAWKGKMFMKAFLATKKLKGTAGTGTVFMGPGV
jgi:hypothetical protein